MVKQDHLKEDSSPETLSSVTFSTSTLQEFSGVRLSIGQLMGHKPHGETILWIVFKRPRGRTWPTLREEAVTFLNWAKLTRLPLIAHIFILRDFILHTRFFE